VFTPSKTLSHIRAFAEYEYAENEYGFQGVVHAEFGAVPLSIE